MPRRMIAVTLWESSGRALPTGSVGPLPRGQGFVVRGLESGLPGYSAAFCGGAPSM